MGSRKRTPADATGNVKHGLFCAYCGLFCAYCGCAQGTVSPSYFLFVDRARVRTMPDVDKLRGLTADKVIVQGEFPRPDRASELELYLQEVIAAIAVSAPNLSSAIQLPDDPSADWSDDDDPTGSGPIDDMAPIGRVTPIPELNDEPTLLGPEVEPRPDWAVGIVDPAPERQHFLDQCAIALFVRGWPQGDCFNRAEILWKIREDRRVAKG